MAFDTSRELGGHISKIQKVYERKKWKYQIPYVAS